ncbi:protein spaetzle-like isoform X2 [Frieseomelitta varia]|uniref:protein spaetzle-like isoform X2 n=1 Tax=Frieseomelitta varia TaxID=561572 RepID=UPI001CB698FE|nr:protein spaetzle-like isoform X2 [Frieseomelitta varia]
MLLNRIGFLLLVLPLSRSSVIREAEPLFQPPPVCKHQLYCENAPNYPSNIVSRELKKNPHLRGYSSIDEVDSLTQDENEPETESLCPSTEEIVVPKSGLTRDGIWMYILNDNNLNQSIRIEQCLERDRSCRMISGLAHGYYTQCKQRYTYRQLWALNNEGAIVQDSFLFATSCCCHVKFRTDKFLKSFETKRFK